MSKTYIICADGACSGNPGPGGYAWEIWDGTVDLGNELRGGAGSHPDTTNNIMELSAARDALEAVVYGANMEVGEIKLRFDSQYVLKGIFEWMSGWKGRGWKTGAGKPVANREIWEAIEGYVAELRSRGFTLTSDWVKGHAGDMGNERVDTKAVEMRDQAKLNEEMDEQVEAQLAGEGINLTDLARQEEMRQATPAAASPKSDDINPMQVDLMRTILEIYGSGDYSVKDVISQIRQNAVALGCR